MSENILDQKNYQNLLSDLETLLSQSKEEIQKAVNAQMTITYWQIGKRIEEEKMTNSANYYNLILEDLENDLKLTKSTLSRATKFFRLNPNKPSIDSALTWSHEKYLMAIKNDDLRLELTQNAQENDWSVKKLSSQIKNLKENGWINEHGNSGNESAGAKNPVGKPSHKSTSAKKTSKLKRPTDPNYLYKAKIVDVVDGDTLILNIDLGFQVIKEQRVRLSQIDAPEISTVNGQESFRYLRDFAARLDEIAVRTNKVDIYGRYLADLFYLNEDQKHGTTQADIFENGSWLNEDLVRAGMAEVF